jgi:hypothetical protein
LKKKLCFIPRVSCLGGKTGTNLIKSMNVKKEKIGAGFIVAWWSAGITSAVACKMALEMYDNVKLYYIDINTAHPDNLRFKTECEKWYGVKINPLQSKEFKNQFDVIEKTGAVNTPQGAPCTKILKKEVRFDFEKLHEITLFNNYTILNQVWGFEYDKEQINRAIRHGQQYPGTKPLFPLIEKGIDKNMCAGLILNEGIALPEMYKLGYTNNNCIGCVKGGKGYWNKIRTDFPPIFDRMAKLERKVGYSCINGTFLDELKPTQGRMKAEIIPNCGLLCEVEFADIPDRNLESVIEGKMTIYEAIAV